MLHNNTVGKGGCSPDYAVLDFLALEQNDTSQLAKVLVENLSQNGFLYLLNHGIPEKTISRTFAAAKEFFELPENTKKQYLRPRGVDEDAGFIPANYERLSNFEKSEKGLAELREAFNFYLHRKEKIPSEVPDFGDAMASLQESSLNLCKRLIELIVIGLDLSPAQAEIIRQGHQYVGTKDSSTKLRSLWYPQIPATDSENELTNECTRLGTHSDYGTLTVLFQDEIGGLESQTRDGRWIKVEPISAVGKNGAVLIQLGDMLQHWTSGRLHSSKHRVRLTSPEQARKTRQSIAFFLHPDNDCFISPLDGTKTDQDITMGDFQKSRFLASYGTEDAI